LKSYGVFSNRFPQAGSLIALRTSANTLAADRSAVTGIK
jgi:hypothetical protein